MRNLMLLDLRMSYNMKYIYTHTHTQENDVILSNMYNIIRHRDCDRRAIITATTRITYAMILWRSNRRNGKTTAVLYGGNFNARPTTAIIYP